MTSGLRHVQYIGYTHYDPSSNLAADLVAQPLMNTVVASYEDLADPAFWPLMKQYQRSVIVPWPFFWSMDEGVPPDAGWVRGWQDFFVGHESQLVAILIADEVDCNYFGATRTDWTDDACDKMTRKLEASIALAKQLHPNARTWVNYTTIWGERLDGRTFRFPRGVDWVSFDCYYPFERCHANELLTKYLQHMESTQNLVLMPPAFTHADVGGLTLSDTLHAISEYGKLAQQYPSVVAIIPFMWTWKIKGHTWRGAGEIPEIRAAIDALACDVVIPGTGGAEPRPDRPPTSTA